MVSFDRDLDDFKGSLVHIRKREGKCYDTLCDRIHEFDDDLLEFSGIVKTKNDDE